ncbi:hypothetical protein NE237_000395 [Protea cynaroides]|uniref:Uncharacterized protein n=1 Tax=Protea cynaroides TaxID=273540 RepID=A0A9Q0KRG9_9MAGN|nr:hypothetical protein NE237_000395 [Protea cynaroides]
MSLRLIKANMSRTIRRSIPDKPTAREYLDAIKEQYVSTDSSTVSTLIAKLGAIKYSESKDVSTSMKDTCFDVFGISKEKKDPKSVKGNRSIHLTFSRPVAGLPKLLDALPGKSRCKHDEDESGESSVDEDDGLKVVLLQEVVDEKAEKLVKKCPVNVFDIEDVVKSITGGWVSVECWGLKMGLNGTTVSPQWVYHGVSRCGWVLRDDEVGYEEVAAGLKRVMWSSKLVAKFRCKG